MGTRIPTVILTTPTGMEICPDGSDIRLTQFDCKWKDDGKDDIELTFESRNVQLISCVFKTMSPTLNIFTTLPY